MKTKFRTKAFNKDLAIFMKQERLDRGCINRCRCGRFVIGHSTCSACLKTFQPTQKELDGKIKTLLKI